MRTQAGAPVLINVSIINNTARYGAGLLSGSLSQVTCIGCLISGNKADHYGGGVLAGGGPNYPVFINSNISNNVALEQARRAAAVKRRAGFVR